MKLATLCYIQKDGKTLLLFRNKKENDMHEGLWIGLGGKLEPGESPDECVVREIEEESGLRIKPRFRGIATIPPFGAREAFKKTWQIHIYTASEFEGELIDSPEGTLSWVDDSEVKDRKMWECDHIWMSWLDKEGVFSAKFIYDDNENLADHHVVFHK